MNNLIEPQNTIKFLKEHGISAKKRYGQNFLIDKRVLDRIIAGSDITGNDTVLEIGPGIGTMTQALCEAAGRVIAVEIDKDMIPVLQENLSAYDNYSIINEDVLKLDLGKLKLPRRLFLITTLKTLPWMSMLMPPVTFVRLKQKKQVRSR